MAELEVQDALVSWSGGKDSALALYEVLHSKTFRVAAILTTLTKDFDRISMHGVRRALVEEQANALGIPLETVWISKESGNSEYEEQMRRSLKKYKEMGVNEVIFGDLFLEEIRKYREEALAQIGMRGVFPLWKRDTNALAQLFIDRGFKAIVCCTDPRALGNSFCGLEFDNSFLAKLPPGVDSCGENGEFHTFVYDCPIFKREIKVKRGDVVVRDGFCFADMIPA